MALQVKGLSGAFAEPEGSPLTWRTDSRYSGLNIGVMGIFYEPLQRCDISTTLKFTPTHLFSSVDRVID